MERLDKKGFVQILFLILLLIGVLVGVFLVQQRTNLKSKANLAGVNLSILPSAIDVTPGQEVQVNVFVDSSDFTTSAIDLHLNFDPNLLDFKSIIPGSILPVVLKSSSVSGNDISITLGANPENIHKGETGTLETVTFIPKQSFTGSTHISLSDQTKVTSLERTDNSVGNKIAATLSLSSSSPSPSISPSSSSSLSPSPSPSQSPSTTPQPTLSTSSSTTSLQKTTASPTPSLSVTTAPTPQTSSPSPTFVAFKTPIPTNTPNPSSAIGLIQQRRNEGIRRPTPSQNPQPSPSAEVPKVSTVTQVTNKIPVLGGIISYIVDSVNKALNFWKGL